MTVTRIEIPEVEGRRLGRHVVHDDASRSFPAEQAGTLRSMDWLRTGVAFDQGDLGSCTGNALGALLMTAPFARKSRVVDEQVCRLIYSLATRLDSASGYWPPNDTGSSGLAVCKAAKNVGLITSYSHTFTTDAALRAIVLNPGIIGVNWYSSFDVPGADGVLRIAPDAIVRGGHELLVSSVDVEHKLVGGWNSWGDWGPKHGRWFMDWSTFDRLLHEQGDATFVHSV